MNTPLRRTWLQLTAWYVVVFGLVLAIFGAALYVVVTREISNAIDRGLVMAVDEAAFALEIREREENVHAEEHVDALDELNVPGHDLYIFNGDSTIIRPDWSPDWVDVAAWEALAGVQALRTVTLPDRTLRLHARAFEIGRRHYAAVAVAEAFALDRQYPDLVRAFLLAGVVSLVLVALGGSYLARKSLVPVQKSFDRMRRFVADASHELRTPAAVLQSTAEVGLQRTRSREEYARILGTIRDESARLGHLVQGLLLLTSADDGRLVIRREPVFLDDLLAAAANAARALATQKNVTILIGNFDEAPVVGDPVLLRQLLLILFDNAIKFSPTAGTVEGYVTARERRARVCIRDYGSGIPAEAMPHIFERFYQADRSRSGTGAGIGLSIAAVIAEAHDATLRIDSREGQGTTVCLEMALTSPVPEPQPQVVS